MLVDVNKLKERGRKILKKLISVTAILTFLLVLPFGGDFASATVSTNEPINLEDVNLSELKPGDVINAEGFTITQYTDEEAAKIIAEQTGKSEEAVLENLKGDSSTTSLKTSKSGPSYATSAYAATASGKCATGATAFSRYLTVKSTYKPLLHVWTELCQNSAGQYVVKSIVDISMNRNYNGTVKQFSGSVTAKALNYGKTLYYRAEGDFYNNGTTTIGGGGGLNTAVASVNFNVSNSSNYFGYIHKYENIVLFK